ncbi:hypothetical protein ACRS8Y_25865 [Bacillus paranthracis]|uniref:hypothetical protein n=1 Tax=Bacillus paranthracis TaxID=2026186 RepID=UPI003EE2FA38
MTKAIFTKGTCKRFELFDTFVQVVLNGGWKLRDGVSLTDNTIDLYTDGFNGDKHLAIQVNCLDSNYSGHNIRTTQYANGSIRLGTLKNDKKEFFTNDGFASLSFFPGRNYSTENNSSYSTTIERLYDIEYYYYVDQEVIVFVVVPFRYTNLGNTVMYIGFPEQSFVEESKRNELKPYSGAIYANSGYSGQSIGKYGCRVVDNPKNLLELSNGTTKAQSVQSIISPLSPNIDNKFVLSELFYGGSDTGTRGRFGRIYFLQPGGMIDGDIIEIKANNEIQKYRYTSLGSASNDYTSFPTYATAIRVE